MDFINSFINQLINLIINSNLLDQGLPRLQHGRQGRRAAHRGGPADAAVLLRGALRHQAADHVLHVILQGQRRRRPPADQLGHHGLQVGQVSGSYCNDYDVHWLIVGVNFFTT